MKSTKELIDPIIGVFSGEDGGVAFAKLRFMYLPYYERMANDITDPMQPQAAALLNAFNIVSRLCEDLLKKETK